MIGVEEALARVLAEAKPLPAERTALVAAAGRALAEPLVASADLPPFDDSSMDGWAVRAADLAAATPGAEVTLPVAFKVHAGERAPRALAPGECARVFTGAPLPDGADAVVKQEIVTAGEAGARFARPARAGEHVRRRGSDVAAGDTALAAGAALGPGELALLAAQGCPYVTVHRRPRVALLATGDELRDLGEPPERGHIVASSTYALAAAVRAAGGEPMLLGIARDDRADARARIHAGLGCDVLLTTGGVSVGDHDLVKDALRESGCQERFWKVAIKPGKPIFFGVGPSSGGPPPGALVFGLPGNPISTMVCFEVFVRPALRALAGHGVLHRPVLEARLERSVHKEAGRREYLRASARVAGGRLHVRPLDQQSSGALSSMVGVNAFVVFPEDAVALHEGDLVRAMLIDAPLPADPAA
ncbi:MAG TPA: gephyrin-like molybdotransferase Glp [Myxococcota bacterium]|nr:gephyrin-like molybdotransferase Glp [Myxococcota bacterium]